MSENKEQFVVVSADVPLDERELAHRMSVIREALVESGYVVALQYFDALDAPHQEDWHRLVMSLGCMFDFVTSGSIQEVAASAAASRDRLVKEATMQDGQNCPQADQPVAQDEREAVTVTDEMVAAYLAANTEYWRQQDELPAQNPSKWRNGTPAEATRASLEAALRAALTTQPQAQPASAAQEREAIIEECARTVEAIRPEAFASDGWQAIVAGTIRDLTTAQPAQKPERKFKLSPEMKATLAKAAETRAQVAEMPNGSIMFINYGDQPEDTSDLDCPYCGGSGHKDDVKLADKPSSQMLTVEQMEDLIAEQAKRIVELEEGKAEQQGEPFAWATFDGEGSYDLRLYENNETYRDEYINRNGEKYADWVVPLYTHTAPQQLSDEQIIKAVDEASGTGRVMLVYTNNEDVRVPTDVAKRLTRSLLAAQEGGK